jgi:hypothetical protein
MFGGDLPVMHSTVSRYRKRPGDRSDKGSAECSIGLKIADAASEAVLRCVKRRLISGFVVE